MKNTYRLVGEEPAREAAGDDVGRAQGDAAGEGEICNEIGASARAAERGSEVSPCDSAAMPDERSSGDRAQTSADGVSKAEAYLAQRRRERNEAIDRLVEEAKGRSQCSERSFWAMIYDFECAPRTTNRAQLAAIGVEVPSGRELADDEVATHLWTVIAALSRLGVYLLNTNHLTDRQLYERLEGDIIDEDVADVVGNDGTQEWIDLCTLEEQEIFDRYYGGSPELLEKAPSDRDERLPRPPNYADPGFF